MTCGLPRGVHVSASSLSPRGSLTALWSAWPGRPALQGHSEYRSVADPSLEHRVQASWSEPVTLRGLRVAWPGTAPQDVHAVALLQGGQEQLLEPGACSDSVTTWSLQGLPAVGVAVIQPPGGGPFEHPDSLHITALSVQPDSESPVELAVERQPGIVERPTMPLHCDGDPATFIDASDAAALHLGNRTGATVAAVELELLRLGSVGGLAWLSRWLSRPDLLSADGQAWPCRRLVDTSGIGVTAGVVAIRLELQRPAVAEPLRLALPGVEPFVLAIRRLWMGGLAGIEPSWQQAEEVKPRPQTPAIPIELRELGRRLLAAGHLPAERSLIPGGGVAYASSVGVPRAHGRAGISVDGGVTVPWGDVHDRCLHLGFGLDGLRLGEPDGGVPARTLDRNAPILRFGWQHGDLTAAMTSVVDPAPTPILDLQWTVRARGRHRRDATARIGLALRDRMQPTPLPLDWQLGGDGLQALRPDGSVALTVAAGWLRPLSSGHGVEQVLQRHLDLSGGQSAVCRMRLPLGRTTGLPPLEPQDAVRARLVERVAATMTPTCDFALPDPVLEATLRRLLVQGTLFIDGDDRVAYGQHPSVYAGDLFGLEEEWLLRGLAGWGLTDLAMRSFRVSLLDEAHFDDSHPLRDLRTALAPWQADHLLALSGLSWQAGLHDSERERLLDCGRWLLAQRQKTTARIQAGEDLVDGLLPPRRYGGDLGWPTQAVHTDAIGCVALAALAERSGNKRWLDEATSWRDATARTLATPGPDDRYRLHTGGGDPGDYHQLMASGFLAAVDFFGPGDSVWAAIAGQLIQEDRLVLGLPRFDAWTAASGDGLAIDAHYGVGFLMQCLRAGRRDLFWTGTAALLSLAMDRDVCTFREVSMLPWARPADSVPSHVPSSRLLASEPCAGGVGVALLLLRHALVTEMPDADGRPRNRLRLLGGVPRTWWRGVPFHVRDAPTRMGPVSLDVSGPAGAEVLRFEVPEGIAVEVVEPGGRVRKLDGGRQEVRLR